MKRMYKVTFFFPLACNGKGKVVVDFAEAYTKKLALKKTMKRYGSSVKSPKVEFYKTF